MSPYLVHHLLSAKGHAPERVALIDGANELTYHGLGLAVDAAARSIVASGLVRGDRVAILLEKSTPECVAILAASRADGVFVPINAGLKPPQVEHIARDCGVSILVTDSVRLNALEAAGVTIPTLKGVLVVDDAPIATFSGAPVRRLQDVTGPLPDARAIGEDLAAILYTSGSTGRPKGVMLSHRNLLAGSRIVSRYLSITGDDRILSILPFSFDYGLNQWLTVVEQGATLVLSSFRFGNDIVTALATHRITGLAGVPSLWAILARAAPALATTPLPHLRYITNSGGAVPTETVKRLRGLLPKTDIYLMYGLTEAFRSTYLPPSEVDRRPGSVGRAIPECEVFLVDAEGRPVPAGTPGILVHRGPTVSLGYWNRPEDTARVIRPDPLRPANQGGGTVCFSGDLMTMDEEGYLFFVGREDAMIKSSGYRISATEVEEALMASGALKQVSVVGLPDPLVGQRVHAVGVPVDDNVDANAVMAHAAKSLAGYMLPRALVLVQALPVTPNGKVDTKALVAEATRPKEAMGHAA